MLSSDDGVVTELSIEPQMLVAAGGARSLDGRSVEVLIESVDGVLDKAGGAADARVRSLRLVEGARVVKGAKSVGGAQPWVSILCKFSDVSVEPKPLSYFQAMYASTYPGLDHYWRDISYDKANVSGSTAVAWVTLPHPVSYYESSSGGNTSAMLNDCTAAADPYVYFPAFVGINMMFNDEFGPYAWGGSHYLSRDGVSRIYRVTWEPPWGYSNGGVIAHEMGHGFGLPHSNNADGDSSPYDNPWDVMSDSWYYVVNHSTYGKLGKGTIAYHRDLLGWIDQDKKLVVDSEGVYFGSLDHLALASTENLRLIEVAQPGSEKFYTAEVRDRVSYDGQLPDFALVIHEVDPGRTEEAWLVDIENPDNGADEGAMWRVGECFEDAGNKITICVQSVTPEGFLVKVTYGETDVIFSNDFETNGTAAWSDTVP